MFVCKLGQWEKSEEVHKICRIEVSSVALDSCLQECDTVLTEWFLMF